MRILMIHNYYQQQGGEDIVFDLECDLLESHGQAVNRVTFHSSSIPDDPSLVQSGRLAGSLIWSRPAAERIKDAVRQHRPDIVHFHNTFPLISSSGYAACHAEGVPIVQTLHNYRLMCSKAVSYRDGAACEVCFNRRVSWPGIRHACYRGSRPMSAALSMMQLTQRATTLWTRRINTFIALSECSRQKFIQAGLPATSVVVKPNFVAPDPGIGSHTGRYAVFVGRLSPEKGIETLLRAWDQLGGRIPLRIVGDGPMRLMVESATRRDSSIEWYGNVPYASVGRLIGDASLLVFPSEWNETFGRTIIEAFATSTPVLASDRGAAVELLAKETAGMLFKSGDANELAQRAQVMFDSPHLLTAMGQRGRAEFESKYTAEVNYGRLMAIYENAIATHDASGRHDAALPKSGGLLR